MVDLDVLVVGELPAERFCDAVGTPFEGKGDPSEMLLAVIEFVIKSSR